MALEGTVHQRLRQSLWDERLRHAGGGRHHAPTSNPGSHEPRSSPEQSGAGQQYEGQPNLGAWQNLPRGALAARA